MRHLAALALLTLAASMPPTAGAGAPASGAGPIAWQPWSAAAFAEARRENRFVLLDLGAVWCHWCHVMERDTYGNDAVAELVRARFVPVRVDQDARPDLSRRYEDYGWPATVVFDAGGREIVKLRGYVPAPRMLAVLRHIVADPSPIQYPDRVLDDAGAAAGDRPATLSPALRETLRRRYVATHDARLGGLAQSHKYLDWNTVEYGMFRARHGDAAAARMARRTLVGALALIDPAWGGAYQYSTHGDWKHPHFEKVMQVQAESLRIYALAYRQFGDARYRRAAEAIHRYVREFLQSPEGAFYASQDADLVKGRHAASYFALGDAGRRRLGIPAVDRRRYARENGWMIAALATLYTATGDGRALDEARVAARWIIDNRALSDGGFRHDASDAGGPYLDDTLAMGRAFLALYAATGEREWIVRADAAARFIAARFTDADRPGVPSAPADGDVLRLRPNVEENIALARLANLVWHHTGAAAHRALAERAMRYLAIEEVAAYRTTEPGILLADAELSSDPAHVTVVGGKGDPAARALHRAALALGGTYRRIEWWDPAEGPLPNPDVAYPDTGRAAAFFCAEGRCSLPVFSPGDLRARAARLARASGPEAPATSRRRPELTSR